MIVILGVDVWSCLCCMGVTFFGFCCVVTELPGRECFPLYVAAGDPA